MKTLQKALILGLAALCITSCSDDEETGPNTGLAEISLLSVESLFETDALASALITSNGGSNIAQKGFCYNTQGNPTINDLRVVSTGGGQAFSEVIPDLELGNQYFFRAYATNASGTAYSNQITFQVGDNPPGGEFELIQPFSASSNTIDFSSGTNLFFEAVFNGTVTWKIEITGLESGALKTIEGTSTIINQLNSIWTGSADEGIFKVEECQAVLTVTQIEGLEETQNIIILETQNYGGIPITDFEQDPGSSIIVRDFEFELDLSGCGRIQTANAAQGQYVLNIQGTDNVINNFFVGLIEINASITGQNYFQFPTQNPSDIFVNMLLFSDQEYTIAIIEFVVDDNNNGQFDPDDVLFGTPEYNFSGNEGWVEINYSMDEIGMTSNDVSKIIGIRAVLISDNEAQPSPTEPVGYSVDNIIFSIGEAIDF